MRIPFSRLLNQTNRVRNDYERQLRTDSFVFLVPITVGLTALITVISYLVWLRHEPNAFPYTPYIVIFGSIILGRYAWQKAHERELVNIEMVGAVFVGGHLLLSTIAFIDLWPVAATALPYYTGFFIVIAGTMIFPESCFTVWGATVLLWGVSLALKGLFTWEVIELLIPAIIINGALALGSYFMTLDWVTAAVAAARSHSIASTQRDEMYQMKEQLEKSNIRQKALYSRLNTAVAVGQKVAALLDLDTLLNQVTDLIYDQLGYNFIGVFLTDDAGATVSLRTKAGDTSADLQNSRRQSLALEGDHVIARAGREHRAAYVSDVLKDNTAAHPYRLVGTRSEVAFPLMVGRQLYGIINLQSYTSGAFDANGVKLLRVLADGVSIALHNATLYRQLVVRHQLTSNLNDIGRAISSTLDLDKVLDLILENLSNIVDSDRTAVLLHRQDRLQIVAHRGFPPHMHPENFEISLSKRGDAFSRILETQEPFAMEDATKATSWNNVEGLRTRSWLGTPLISDDRVVGMLSLAREKVQPYQDDEIDLTMAFAAQAAVALANARLYERTKRFNQELESKVQERTQQLSEANEQLARLDRAKSDFIGVAAHELRTPLTVLRGYSDMLKNDQAIKENNYHLQLIDGIRNGAIRMHEIVNDMLDVVKLDSRRFDIHLESVDLKEVLDAILRRLREDLQERDLTINMDGLEDLGEIEADRDAMSKAFHQIIINAIKYTPDGRSIHITGKVLPNGGEQELEGTPAVQISVCDEGIGIDPEYHELIFTKFYQTGEVALHSSGKTKFKGGGPGLGLAIAQGYIAAQHGRIWVESEGHDEEIYPGSCFHVQFPVTQPEPEEIEDPTTASTSTAET